MLLRVIIIAFFLGSILRPAFAGEIFKWVDENGVTHYTSKKPHPEAKPAELPEIMRGEFKTPVKFGATCDKHGGINCQSGPDADGSVICTDGFKNASARYTFQCNSPKLVISDISEVDERGEFKVFIRNTNSVSAKAPKVEFFYGDEKKVDLNGPISIEPYGVAEFTFTPTADSQIRSKPTEVQLSISCGNCG